MLFVIFITIIILVWGIKTSNRFKVLIIKIQEADSGIEVALTKRYDTLTKLVDVVKAYSKHETDILLKIVKIRSGMDMNEKAEVISQMDDAKNQLFAIAESYPELRSSENYKHLQESIIDAEDNLQAARRVYNMNISLFNQSIIMFPASIIADSFNYKTKGFFQAEKNKTNDIKIEL